ncbi:MAG: FtsX-like permease family protein, partial [Blastocatellia bacterium]
MPSGSQFQSATDVWIPLTIPPAARNDRGQHYLRAVARLKPGATVHQAQAEMNIIASRLAQQYPDENQDRGILVLTMRDNQVGDLKPAMLVLLGAVAFVLLIACTNVANLLLSKAAVRRKEFAIRCALGAERGRILRQLLTESVLLALLGGVLGLLLAEGAIEVLGAVAPAGIPRLASARLNPVVLIFTIGISLLTGLIFGMAPAIHASRPDLHEDLKEGGRGAGAPVQRRLRSLLVISEVLLVSVLLIAAGLMLKSFQRLLDIDPGFNAKDVLTARVALPAAGYPANKIAVFYHQLLDQLGAQSSVDSAAVVRDLPFGGTDPRYGFTIEGRPVSSQNDGYGYRYRVISPNYFRVMSIPVKGGRDFNYHDDANGQAVAIINESAATKYWPGENPLGQVILSDGTICS